MHDQCSNSVICNFPPMSAPAVHRTCESVTRRLPTKLPTSRKKRPHRRLFQDLIKQPLETVSHPALQGTEGHIAPKHLKYIGSYNWIDASTPTIIVPGQSIVSLVPRLIRATPRTTLVVYRESSDMDGEAHTPGCSPRQRQGFHRPERSPHETQIHSPPSHQSRPDHRDPEEGPIQVRLVFSRFRDRPNRPAEVGCVGKQQIRPRVENRHPTRGREDRSHEQLATGNKTDQRAV